MTPPAERTTHGAAARPRRIALLVILIFVLLCAQLIFAYAVDEPYPGVVFPAFGGAPKTRELPTTAQSTRAQIVATVEGGALMELAPATLYPGPHAAILSVMMARTCPQPDQAKAKREARAKHGHKAYYKLKVYLEDEVQGGYYRHEHPELGPWLLRRAQEVTGQQVRQVAVHWRQREIALATQATLSDTLIHTCTWSDGALARGETP